MITTIEVEPEQVNAIIVNELKLAIESFEEDILSYESGKGHVFAFDADPIKDVQILSEYVAAFEKVLEYYGTE